MVVFCMWTILSVIRLVCSPWESTSYKAELTSWRSQRRDQTFSAKTKPSRGHSQLCLASTVTFFTHYLPFSGGFLKVWNKPPAQNYLCMWEQVTAKKWYLGNFSIFCFYPVFVLWKASCWDLKTRGGLLGLWWQKGFCIQRCKNVSTALLSRLLLISSWHATKSYWYVLWGKSSLGSKPQESCRRVSTTQCNDIAFKGVKYAF